MGEIRRQVEVCVLTGERDSEKGNSENVIIFDNVTPIIPKSCQ
jgi:hypothetical protein